MTNHRFRRWAGIHRESIYAILIIVLIFAGLVIIWGGTDKEDGGLQENSSVVFADTPKMDYAQPVTIERPEDYHVPTTVRASRGGKTRTVIPKARTIPAISTDLLARRMCESTNNYSAVSKSGKYRGAYQFDQTTWDRFAEDDWKGKDPATAPPEVQDETARKVTYDAWPNCP